MLILFHNAVSQQMTTDPHSDNGCSSDSLCVRAEGAQSKVKRNELKLNSNSNSSSYRSQVNNNLVFLAAVKHEPLTETCCCSLLFIVK